MTPLTTADLIAQFEDIALQRHLMRPRVADRALVAAGWTLRYAVDANVLRAYVAPEEDAERGVDGRSPAIGLGEVFRRDPLSRKQDISASLMYHIWHHLQPVAPLLILAPLEVEFRALINFFLGQHVESGANARPDPLQELLTELDGTGRHLHAADLERIRFAVTRDNRRHARLRRLRQVLSRDRIRHAQSPLEERHFDDVFRSALKADESDLERSLKLAALKSNWATRLTEVGRRQSVELRRDAEALARLELVNRGIDKARRRLVYITNDSSVLQAGEACQLVTTDGSTTTFSEAFLRHPRAFLDEPGVLNPHPSLNGEGTSLTDWMNVLLGQFDDAEGIAAPMHGRIRLPNAMVRTIVETVNLKSAESPVDPQTVSDGTQGMSRRFGDFDIESRWSKYEAASSRDAPDAALHYLLRHVRDRSQAAPLSAVTEAETEGQIRSIREAIQEIKNHAWEDFFVVSRANRLIIEISERDVPQIRDVAPVCFEGRPKLLDFLNLAKVWLSPEGEFSRDDYLRCLDEIREEDPSGYSDYLGHANLLAHQGHWRSAAILCVRAKERTAKQVTTVVGSNGREANYLEAFYLRLSARRREDLEGLDNLLKRAREIYDYENMIALGGPGSQWPHDAVPERFTSEELALKLTGSFFDWARAPRAAQEAALEDMAQLVPLFSEHAQMLAQQIATSPSNLPPGPVPDRVTPAALRVEIRTQLRRRALRNVLSIGLLHADHRSDAEEAWRELPDPDSHEGRQQSQYSAFLWLSGAAMFEPRKKAREEAWRKLIRQRDDGKLLGLRTFPYDEKRIDAVMKIIEEKLAG